MKEFLRSEKGVLGVGVLDEIKKITADMSNDFPETNTITYLFFCALTIYFSFCRSFLMQYIRVN